MIVEGKIRSIHSKIKLVLFFLLQIQKFNKKF